ncbi:MAG: glycoside hydrolase family 9 protein, partial [Bryobacterales bacterium]|nr:glycoside hydrolase family 9 protein [Bryobacterales bacterium]
LTREKALSGTSSLLLTSPTTGDKPRPTTRYYGAAGALHVVEGEDWSRWNRISVWIYPDLPGFRVVSLLMIFHNQGAEPVPDAYGKMGLNYVILQNHRWNRVVWEIANLPRDRVTGLEFSYRMQGNEPGASETVRFFIDRLELERVNEDHYLGWNVAPGQFAFSHSGYQIGFAKTALASDLTADSFELVNVSSGLPAASKPVQRLRTRLGEFQLLDFSEVEAPGTYVLRAGERTSRPFRIGADVWKSSLWKAINFFFVERCGYAVPGVHDVCHRDWLLVHGDKRIVANGGWHDAGDLSQSLINTAEAVYAMFALAERLRATGEDPELEDRLVQEANWGLDWLLKVTFHDGYRPGFCTMDRWTNGIIGDLDDMVCQAVNSPAGNFSAAAAEALAARILKPSDPIRSAHSLKQAIEDWNFAVAGFEKPTRGAPAEIAGMAVLAALELYQATGEWNYAERATAYARIILDSQQRSFLPELTEPLTGFFYTGPEKKRILRYDHISRETAPVVALVRLCELLPEHPQWMEWYSAVAIYSEYFHKAMSRMSEPYAMLANSIYHDEEYKQAGKGKGATAEAYREQVLNGIKVGARHYVRLFPVWFEFRGNHGTVLTQAKALSAAAHLRSNFELAALAHLQLQWVVGRNPFAQSTMWGEGYDYAPQYTAMSGDIVGSLPVGIQTRGNTDLPYWPTENCHNWKEVWVHPVTRWIWLMRDLAGPAFVSGRVTQGTAEPVTFQHLETASVTLLWPEAGSSVFRGALPAGEYAVSRGGTARKVTLLPGGMFHLDLRSEDWIELKPSASVNARGLVHLEVTAEGSGRHTISLRTSNLELAPTERTLRLEAGRTQTLSWEGKPKDPAAPWVVVVVPDGDLTRKRELLGWRRNR